MRKIYTLLLTMLLYTGCSKDENVVTPGMSATINNTAWSAFTIDTHTDYMVPSGFAAFTIKATSLDDQELTFTIFGTKTGKYLVHENCEITYSKQLNIFTHESYNSKSGELNLSVDTLKNEISGTFSFVAKPYYKFTDMPDSLVITNGKFNNLRYTDFYMK
jgi:hypothetical protein